MHSLTEIIVWSVLASCVALVVGFVAGVLYAFGLCAEPDEPPVARGE
jgi:hypothetical protein